MDEHPDDTDETQWTEAARVTYERCAREFLDALHNHVRLSSARQGRQRELREYAPSQQRLLDAARAFADAEFDWCGSFPLPLDSDEDDEGWDNDDADAGSGEVLSLIGRWDYRITDPHSLIAAGRQAYLDAFPDDTSDDAAFRVGNAVQAAGEILHGDNLARLDAAPGLEPRRSIVNVVVHDGQDDFDTHPFRLVMPTGDDGAT